jgi:hypothetical protein
MTLCSIAYEPERGELTGLVRLPNTPWDQRDTWWLDCLVTYETEPPRTEGLVLPVVVKDPALDVLQEAARLLGNLCVVAAVVCCVRRPMPLATIQAIQVANAVLVADRRAARARAAAANPAPAPAAAADPGSRPRPAAQRKNRQMELVLR